jgi:hypothetical protein
LRSAFIWHESCYAFGNQGVAMSSMPHKVKNQIQSVTVDTTIVPIGEPLNYSLAARAVATFQTLLWPPMIIAVAALASVFWTAVLLWIIGHAIW